MIKSCIKMAWNVVKINRLHSYLTISSIIIGIASIILITSLGRAAKSAVVQELDSLGGNELCIYKDGLSKEVYIDNEDIKLISEGIRGIEAISAQVTLDGKSSVRTKEYIINLECVMYDYRKFDSKGLMSGKYFSEFEYEKGDFVALISYNDAMRMFGSIDVVGKRIPVVCQDSTYECIIIGVQSEQNVSLTTNYVYDDTPIQLIIPMTVAESIYPMYKDSYDQIFIIVETDVDMAEVGEEIVSLLARRHQVESDCFQIANYNNYIKMINRIILIITSILSLIATISIIVGGLGVTNMMLMNVKLRTTEIGIRKAMGAKNKHILIQFLAEAEILTGIGGTMGIVVGMALSKVTSIFIQYKVDITLPVDFSMLIVGIVFIVSVGLGAICGIFPANRAAKMAPIEAFRV